MNYKQAIREHAIKRFQQRLGIKLSLKEYIEFNKKCNDRSFAEYRGMNGTNQILFVRNYQGFSFKVVFDGIRNKMVTILPESIKYGH